MNIKQALKINKESKATPDQNTSSSKGKVNYTQVPFSRKRNESGSTPRMRELYNLKSELHGSLITINFYECLRTYFFFYCRKRCE